MVGGALRSADMNDFDLRMSEGVRPLYEAVKEFIATEVDPITEEYFRLGEGRADRWSYAPGQLELLEGAKTKARELGLWNFFLPNAETGEGLSNLDYAYIANELGKNPLASECLNCSAPDTGNMEVLERVGTPEQKKQWPRPRLEIPPRAYDTNELAPRNRVRDTALLTYAAGHRCGYPAVVLDLVGVMG